MSKPQREVMRLAHRRAKRALEAMTDEDDAEITRAAEADPDAQPATEEMLARLRPATEVAPEIMRRARGQRGPQKSRPVKIAISLRLDPDVLDYFRRRGPGWQRRMNAALRNAARLPRKPRVASVRRKSAKG
jgi:uncharacterized protein (DUF4415 family)